MLPSMVAVWAVEVGAWGLASRRKTREQQRAGSREKAGAGGLTPLPLWHLHPARQGLPASNKPHVSPGQALLRHLAFLRPLALVFTPSSRLEPQCGRGT